MQKHTDNVGIREVYELVDKKISDVNQSINRLSDAFSTLESGRLSNLEKNVANMQGRMTMISLLVTIAMNVFFFIIDYMLKNK